MSSLCDHAAGLHFHKQAPVVQRRYRFGKGHAPPLFACFNTNFVKVRRNKKTASCIHVEDTGHRLNAIHPFGVVWGGKPDGREPERPRAGLRCAGFATCPSGCAANGPPAFGRSLSCRTSRYYRIGRAPVQSPDSLCHRRASGPPRPPHGSLSAPFCPARIAPSGPVLRHARHLPRTLFVSDGSGEGQPDYQTVAISDPVFSSRLCWTAVDKSANSGHFSGR